jgi:hypothetical protein
VHGRQRLALVDARHERGAWFDVVVDAVAGLSPVEREAVLTSTACAAYRVVPHAVAR